MLEKIRSLKLVYKLSLMAGVMVVPLMLIGLMFIQAKNQEIDQMQSQIDSLSFLDPVHRLQQHVLLHRGLSQIVTSDSSYRPQLASNETEIDTDFAAVQKADALYGKVFGTSETLTRIREHWQEIRNKVGVFNAREMFDAHTRVVSELLDMIRLVGDNAVVMDTSLDTYYLGNNLLLQLPGAADSIGQLRYVGSEVLINGSLSPDERNRLTTIIANIRRYAAPKSGRIVVGLETAYKANSRVEDRTKIAMTAAIASSETLIQSVQDNMMGPKITGNLKEHWAMATDAVSNIFKLYDAVDDAYRAEVGKRISASTNSKYLDLALAFLALVAAGLLVRWISGAINGQVNSMTRLFSSLGIGDFAARAEVYSEDELGQATHALNTMLDSILTLIQSREERDKIQDSIHTLLEEISGLADGDLTQEAQVSAEITGALADAFNNMAQELRGIISKVQDTTLAVSLSATEVQGTTEHLATGSESQALQIVEASAAIDEMAVSIQQVSSNAASAASVADRALNSAKLGAESVLKTIDGMNGIRQQVQQTAKRMKRLGESSQEIGEIAQLINDIAERTTILALNASIQAAMAGDAGKGFAVVAEEVERLAEHSTEATKKIAGLIKSIQTDTNEAIAAMEETTREVVAESSLANDAGQKLQEIEKVSTQLSEIIQSISMASKQQSRGSEGVAKSMSEISQVTQQTAAGAKQAAISIRKLAMLADNLRDSLNRFKLPTRRAA
jgi:twitching motility protein PilJ